jgi:hypothetical protein
MMAYLTRPEPEVLPQPKPQELLDIQEDVRIQRQQDTMDKARPFLMDESVDFIEREEFNRGSDYMTNRVTDPERLKFLNEAAKKFGYKDWNSVPKTKPIPGKRAYGDRENIAQEATRRQKGVVEGKGRPGVEKDYKVISNPKDQASDAYLQRDLRRTKNQADVLKAAQSGKYKTAEEIRKAVGFTKEVFNKEVTNLFKNVYTQIGDLNKPKKMQSRFGVRFLPRDVDKMYEIRNQLGQIAGFEPLEVRNVFSLIADAYGQQGTNPNRKAYAEATRKASDFFRIRNEIKRKYPNIRLELEHPLDYKTIKGLSKGGEKFLFVTPVEKAINRGFKASLGDAYAKAVKAKDMEKILKIENLADDIGVTIGKVRGSKVMDYGTGPLRTTNIGDEIIANLRQQNVIVDNVKKLQKSGELKTRMADIGMPQGGKLGYSAKKVSEAQIKNIEKIIASIACPGKAMGGRIGFQDGTSCFEKGKKMINTGNIPEGAAKKNFINFANKAMAIGKQAGTGLRTITKFGIIPEAIILGADTLIRTGMGDTFDEAFKRASDIYRTDEAYEQADASEINRRMNSNDGELILNLRKFNNERAKLSSLEQQKEADLTLAGDDFAETNSGMTENEIEKFYAPKIQEQENNLFNASISDAEERAGLAKETEFADKKGVAYKKSIIGKPLDLLAEVRGFKQVADLFNTGTVQQPDVSAQAIDNYAPDAFKKTLQKYGPKVTLDAIKRFEAEQEYPEGAIRKKNLQDEERRLLLEAAKNDPALAELYFGPRMTFAGDPIDQTDLQDEMNLDRGIYSQGGRIGFKDGPKNPGRRTFIKGMGILAAIPFIGKFIKPAAPLVKKLANSNTVMPDWFPKFVDKFVGRSIGKKIDADLMEYTNPDLPNIKLTRKDDGSILVEGKNEFNEVYNISYEPPGYELIDEKTGKAVKTKGEFEAVEGRHVALGPEDYDTDAFYADELDELYTSDIADMEKYTTGNVTDTAKDAFGRDTGLKKGMYDSDMAQGRAENQADILADEGLDEID